MFNLTIYFLFSFFFFFFFLFFFFWQRISPFFFSFFFFFEKEFMYVWELRTENRPTTPHLSDFGIHHPLPLSLSSLVPLCQHPPVTIPPIRGEFLWWQFCDISVSYLAEHVETTQAFQVVVKFARTSYSRFLLPSLAQLISTAYSSQRVQSDNSSSQFSHSFPYSC